MISLAGATQHRRGSLIPGLTRDLLRNNLNTEEPRHRDLLLKKNPSVTLYLCVKLENPKSRFRIKSVMRQVRGSFDL